MLEGKVSQNVGLLRKILKILHRMSLRPKEIFDRFLDPKKILRV